MDKIWLNSQVYLDLEDLHIEKFVSERVALPNPLKEEKRSFVEFSSNKLFARLVAGKRFITQGRVIEEGQKGGYIEIGRGVDINDFTAEILHGEKALKPEDMVQYTLVHLLRGRALAKRVTTNKAIEKSHAERVNAAKVSENECVMSKIPPEPQVDITLQYGAPHIRIGENSWIGGSFIGTEAHRTFVQRGAKIGAGTYIGSNCHIGKNVVIGDNVYIGYTSKIGDRVVIDHDVKIEDANIGPKTEIARATTIGMKKLSGVTAIGPRCNIGISPNFYNKFWWMRGKYGQNYPVQPLRVKDIWQRFVLEGYYRHLSTRVGANVQMDAGVWVESGATVGNGAKLGYCMRVPVKGKIENESVNEK